MRPLARGRRFGGGRPPWWPENEAWPPSGPLRRHRVVRVRFFRRFALVAAVLLWSALIGLVTVGWSVAGMVGLTRGAGGGVAPVAFGAGLAGAVVAIGLLGRTLRRIGTPLGDIMDAAERVAGGDYSVRVREFGPPPVLALARAFNSMAARLQEHDRQRRDLMADVAHELRTPLTVMQGRLEGLLDGVYPLEPDQLAQVLDETHVLSRLVEDLRTLALSDAGALKLEKEAVDLAALAREVARTFEPEAAKRGVALAVDTADVPPVDLDLVRIRQVLGNLVSNALRHTPSGASIVVSVAAAPPASVRLEVSDSGAGMSPEDLRRAFDRFHKGPESRGSGLGLTIARSLVLAHGGAISASSEPGRGTTVTVTLPRRGPAEETGPSRPR